VHDGTSIVFLGNQFPMPSQQRLGRDNGGHFRQNPLPQHLCRNGQSPPLMAIEAQPPATEFRQDLASPPRLWQVVYELFGGRMSLC